MKCYKCKTTENLKPVEPKKMKLDGTGTSYVCKPCTAAIAKAYYDRVKETVFAYYGKICACCGEDEELFLTIDHVNNDGHLQIGSTGKRDSGRTMYAKIIKAGLPNTYQTLCMNCNFGKMRNEGVCPHMVDKELKDIL